MEYTQRLSAATGMAMIYIKYGRIPLGHTRACYGELGICSHECGKAFVQLENVKKGYHVQLLCEEQLGYRTVLKDEKKQYIINQIWVFKERHLKKYE